MFGVQELEVFVEAVRQPDVGSHPGSLGRPYDQEAYLEARCHRSGRHRSSGCPCREQAGKRRPQVFPFLKTFRSLMS